MTHLLPREQKLRCLSLWLFAAFTPLDFAGYFDGDEVPEMAEDGGCQTGLISGCCFLWKRGRNLGNSSAYRNKSRLGVFLQFKKNVRESRVGREGNPFDLMAESKYNHIAEWARRNRVPQQKEHP